MQINLNDEEAQTLREMLDDYLPELRMEIARTDLPARELIHKLARRRELCERLTEELDRAAGPAARRELRST